MKLSAAILFVLLLLFTSSGCVNQPYTCESASYSLHVGPFFEQDATIAGVSKQADGSAKIGNFTGSTSYLGIFTTTQSFHDLVLSANQALPK